MNLRTLLPSLLLSTLLAPLMAQEPPTPGPQHLKIARSAGSWDCVIDMIGEDGKPTQSKGTTEARMLLGGLWLVDEFKGDFMGAPFEGHGTTGYDPAKGKVVVTWIDSWTPSLLLLEGDFDASGKVLTVSGMGVGMDGKPAKYRNVTTWHSDDKFVFEMHVTGSDGKEVKGLTITYTRRTKKTGGK